MTDGVAKVPTTVCIKCKLHFDHEKGSPREHVWYNHYCKANPRERVIDPVTGIEGYGGVNDLGGFYITDEKYRHCRDLNKGMCPLFQQK